MTKKLLVQIKNEWRNNLWLALELLVVSVVMWFVVDYLYTRTATYLEPRGFDISHCYLIEMGKLTDKSPDYIPNQTDEQEDADILELVDRLRRRPEIEAVSLSQNSYPYNGSNSTDLVQYDTLVSGNWTIRRLVTPDFVRVFRYQGTRGETPEQLAGMLEKGEFLASDNLYRKYGHPLTEFVGKSFRLFGDTIQTYRLGAALKDVRYNDFEQARDSYTFLYKLDWYDTGLELCVRVRENQDHDFIQRLKTDSEKQFRIGNIFISEIRSFKDIRRNFQQTWSNDLRNYVMGMGFLLLNIFLGLLGTFWFRTQQRRSEIALHKVHGASDMSILKDVRYNDFEQARDSYTFLYKLDWYDTGLELCVRVRENQDHDFIQRLKTDSEKQFRIGNIFISEIRSFKDIRRNFQQTWSNDLRNYVMGMGFLLLNIFLGLLGTFWFRTQQRRSEIALHKVHGASDMSIFTRLISEGLLLLLLVTPVALLIDYNLASMELNSWRNGTTLEWERLLLCAAISFLLIGLMIAIGIGIPARRAMKVQPAEALHDE